MSLAIPLLVIAAIVVQFTDAYRAVPLGDLSIFNAHIMEAMTYVPGSRRWCQHAAGDRPRRKSHHDQHVCRPIRLDVCNRLAITGFPVQRSFPA